MAVPKGTGERGIDDVSSPSAMATRRTVEVDLLDVGPGHVLGALTAIDEDQHAGISVAEVASALELQLLAVMEDHPGALGAAPFAARGNDRGDQAEGDGVV